MQITIKIPNKQMLEEILSILNKHKIDGLEIVEQKYDETITDYNDDYISQNWNDILKEALVNYINNNYDWKQEYGDYLLEKNI